MGIKSSFESNPSIHSLKGLTPSTPDLKQSNQHNTYSINGEPTIGGLPVPSRLDLNGSTPSKYLDNKPS